MAQKDVLHVTIFCQYLVDSPLGLIKNLFFPNLNHQQQVFYINDQDFLANVS